jgi:hypothetical protein
LCCATKSPAGPSPAYEQDEGHERERDAQRRSGATDRTARRSSHSGTKVALPGLRQQRLKQSLWWESSRRGLREAKAGQALLDEVRTGMLCSARIAAVDVRHEATRTALTETSVLECAVQKPRQAGLYVVTSSRHHRVPSIRRR